jgi:putative modified peptide
MMMANELNPEQIEALLDLLSTNQGYRDLFVNDLGAALAKLPGNPSVPPGLPDDSCLRPTKLASMEAIARTRVLLNRFPDQLQAFIPKLLEP